MEVYLYNTYNIMMMKMTNDDHYSDDDDDYSCKSVNFQAMTSKCCMEVYLDNNYNMMIMMIIAVTQEIFKPGTPNFAWKYI